MSTKVTLGINGIKITKSQLNQLKRTEALERKCAACSKAASTTQTLLNCSSCRIGTELNGE